MIAEYEVNLHIPNGISPPDIFLDSTNETSLENFVVSRHRDGSVASFFKDNTWNLTAYHPREEPHILNFEFWESEDETPVRKALAAESRQIMFSLMWFRKGASLSVGTLRNYLYVINVLARYCEKNNLTFHDVIADERKIWNFVKDRKLGWHTQTFGSLLPHLNQNKFGFSPVNIKLIKAIQSSAGKYRDTLNQHPPIPTRIYSSIIAQMSNILTEWGEVADDMLRIAQICKKDRLIGRTLSHQARTAKDLGVAFEGKPTFDELLPALCLKYLSERGIKESIRGLFHALLEIQLTAKLIVQTFTGMRDEEALSLPFNCIEVSVNNGLEHYIIVGTTTKLNNGRSKPARWVTNSEGIKAIQSAQKIAKAIYSVFDIDDESLKSKKYPLFVSTGYLAYAKTHIKPGDSHVKSNSIPLFRVTRIRKLLEPEILDEDIAELEQIDPYRAWRSEQKFFLGSTWVFTTHQLRRSLALYAQRSGLVSLPSLRRQLQHITNEMSLYYCKGSIYAKDFVGDDKNHFAHQWRETKSESEGLSYILNVILSNDMLFGGHALWVKEKVKGPNGTVTFDRERTLRQFKKGEIAYQETILGGCTSTQPCKQPALKLINTTCLSDGCKYLVCHMSKLDRVISAQTKLVDNIDENLLEYRTERSDLDILIKARDKAVSVNSKD